MTDRLAVPEDLLSDERISKVTAWTETHVGSKVIRIEALRTELLQKECVCINWEPSRQDTDHFTSELDPADTHAVDYLAAPVFDWRAHLAFSNSVAGVDMPLIGAKIVAMADELMARCRKLGRFLDETRHIVSY